MAADQDEIGWQCFMKGMVCHCARDVQTTYSAIKGSSIPPLQWNEGLVIKLLKATHGQWLYRCVQTHNRVMGMRATARKEELLQEIERQLELGTEDLLDEINTWQKLILMTLKVPPGNSKNTGYLQFVLHGRPAYSVDNRHQIFADGQL
jgi:hypothetical protein